MHDYNSKPKLNRKQKGYQYLDRKLNQIKLSGSLQFSLTSLVKGDMEVSSRNKSLTHVYENDATNKNKKDEFQAYKYMHKNHHSYADANFYRSSNDLKRSIYFDQKPIVDWNNRKRYNQFTLKSMNREEIKDLIKISKTPIKTNRVSSVKLNKSEDVQPEVAQESRLFHEFFYRQTQIKTKTVST